MRRLFGLLAVVALAVNVGCSGPGLFDRQSWLFGKDPPDDPELLARIGPTPNQRMALVKSMREKMTSSPAEAEQVANELATRIQTETDPLVRVEIIQALSASKSRAATGVFRAGLGYPKPDPDPEVRAAICQAWANVGDGEARTMLSAALANDTDVDVRIEAARSLGKFKDGANTQALAAALEDSDIGVQHTAMQSMKSVSGKDYGDNAEKWREYARSGTVSSPTPSIAERLWPWTTTK